MALPSSGPLTLAQIQGEFGGSNPISLSEYYAGGGLVPAGTSGTYGAVPSSGTISIQNFYGTSNVTASIVIQNYTGGSAAGTPYASSYVVVYSDGSAFFFGQQSGTTLTQWLNPIATNIANGFEVRFQYTADFGFQTQFTDGGGFNNWLTVTGSRYAGMEAASGTAGGYLVVSARQASNPGTVYSATFILQAVI